MFIYTKEHPDGEPVTDDAVNGAITRLIDLYMKAHPGPASERLARLAELECNRLAQALNERDREIARLRVALEHEDAALTVAANDAQEQRDEANLWRERADTFERRIKAVVEDLRDRANKLLDARDRRSDSRRRWGHERGALAYGVAATLVESVLTSEPGETASEDGDA